MALPIGGFMPIPLAIMIPFMAAQSMIMGDSFGRAFQFGKRKISAMTNEEFNAYTPKDMVSEMTAMYKEVTPNLIQMMKDSTELQNQVIAQMLDIPREALSALFGATVGDTGGASTTAGAKTPAERQQDVRPTKFTPSTVIPVEPNSFQNPDCTSVRKRAQELINFVNIQYQRYIDATGNQKNNAKVSLTKASTTMNLYIQANTKCLKGWSPQ